MRNPFKRPVIQKIEVIVPPVVLGPHDTLVVQCERRVPRDVFVKLQERIRSRWPGGNVIVLEAGLKVSAVIEGEVR